MSKKLMLKRMMKSSFFIIGILTTFFIIGLVIFAPQITPFDPNQNNLTERLLPPDGLSKGLEGHIFGTDNMGRDLFARVLYGGRSSFFIAFTSTFLSAALGIILGLIAGYYGGWADIVIGRLCDIFIAIPSLVMGIVVTALFGVSIVNLIGVMIATSWIKYTKIGRNNVVVAKSMEYVHAAKVMGASGWRIMIREIFPNVTTPLLIQISQGLGSIIILESTLSFLNLGIAPPDPSWGNMITNGRDFMATHPWMVVAPGCALMLTVLAFNFLGDGLRDVLDPKRYK